MERVKSALGAFRYQLLSLDNVVGVGIGYKEKQGKPTGEYALKVLVKKKLPMAHIMVSQRVPCKLGTVLTDVEEVGEIVLLTSRTDRLRPAQPGVSIGHYKVTAGTFGALVRDSKSGELLILSNNHVLANITDGRDGRGKKGDPIYQPGKYDGGTAQDVIGYLDRFVPLVRETTDVSCALAKKAQELSNLVLNKVFPSYELRLVKRLARENIADAAAAKLISPDLAVPEILELGYVRGVAKPQIGMKVKKSGRTSGVTSGIVKVVDATLRVQMGDVGSAVFSNQLVTTAMAEPGDSGSLVVTQEGKAVGLLAAGSSSATICNRIDKVLEELGVELVTR